MIVRDVACCSDRDRLRSDYKVCWRDYRAVNKVNGYIGLLLYSWWMDGFFFFFEVQLDYDADWVSSL